MVGLVYFSLGSVGLVATGLGRGMSLVHLRVDCNSLGYHVLLLVPPRLVLFLLLFRGLGRVLLKFRLQCACR